MRDDTIAAPRTTADAAETMATSYTDFALSSVELLIDGPAALHHAVLDRDELVAGWDLRNHGPEMPADMMLVATKHGDIERDSGAMVATWPSNVSHDEVYAALLHTKDEGAAELVAWWRSLVLSIPELDRLGAEFQVAAKEERITTANELAAMTLRMMSSAIGEKITRARARWPVGTCAHILSVAKRVEEDRRRQAIAIDAGKVHHAILTGMRDLPKDRQRHTGGELRVDPPKVIDGVPRIQLIGVNHKRKKASAEKRPRFEVIAPGLAVQLTFPFDAGSPLEAMIATLNHWRGPLQDWKGPAGLRHWAAILRLLSIEGAREGKVKWTMERHLEAIGASKECREDAVFLRDVGRVVELLTKLELAVYAPDGTLRLREQILSGAKKIDRRRGSTWSLEGMELSIHPLLYSGVRKDNGEAGSNWFPQTEALAKLDHIRHPHAIALGLVLPIRWRWDWGDGRDCTSLSGAKLLETAGIPCDKLRRLSDAWRKARAMLDKLQEIGALGRVEWEGEAWTLSGICRLYPPQWARDRTVHALPAVEAPVLPPAVRNVPATGDELLTWRKAQGLTQAEAAKQLHVSERTIRNAETDPAAPLGWALRKAFAKQPAPPQPATSPTPTPPAKSP
jgi:DNA-binding XRE family transcriptional regulator